LDTQIKRLIVAVNVARVPPDWPIYIRVRKVSLLVLSGDGVAEGQLIQIDTLHPVLPVRARIRRFDQQPRDEFILQTQIELLKHRESGIVDVGGEEVRTNSERVGRGVSGE